MTKARDSIYSGTDDKITPFKRALPQVLVVTVKNILLVAFGMTLGYPTILIPGLSDANEPFWLDQDGLSWIGSVNLICVPVGCIISGAISEAIGRKRAMQLVNIPFVIAWLLLRFSTAEWQIFVALALTGLCGGFLEAPVLTYVAEISQPHLRGMLSSTSSLAVILGVLMMFCLGTFYPWRTVAFISCIVNVVSFNFLFLIPESPHWLVSKNRLLDARKSLAWLRGWTTLDAIEPEYKQIYREIKEKPEEGVDNVAFDGNMNGPNGTKRENEIEIENDKNKIAGWKLYFKKSFLWPYGLVTFIFVLSHFTGMTTLQVYAIQIFVSLHAPIDKYYATVILGIVELIGCILCVILVHYTGKRILNFVSLIIGSVCFILVGTYTYIIKVDKILIPQKLTGNETIQTEINPEYANYTWIPLTFLVGFALVAHMGIRVLPWILIGEVYSNETRAAGSGLSSASSYILGFISNKIFFRMIGTLTLAGTFWFYGCFSLFGCVILYFILPETEGKTLGEINEHFSGGKKMGNHVFRGFKEEFPIRLGTLNQTYVSDTIERQTDSSESGL